MTQRRTVGAILFSSIFAAGMWAGTASAEDGPCEGKTFKFPKVEAACKKGGKKAATTLMKAAVKKAKAAGKDWKCTECHPKANETGKLKDGASDKLKEFM